MAQADIPCSYQAGPSSRSGWTEFRIRVGQPPDPNGPNRISSPDPGWTDLSQFPVPGGPAFVDPVPGGPAPCGSKWAEVFEPGLPASSLPGWAGISFTRLGRHRRSPADIVAPLPSLTQARVDRCLTGARVGCCLTESSVDRCLTESSDRCPGIAA